MSVNLYLSASRTVLTKSGKGYVERESINLMQTPTKVTMSIVSLPTFEGQLEAYCQWVQKVTPTDEDDSPSSWDWCEIYDVTPTPKERAKYFILDHSWRDDYYVKDVALKGEPLFEEISRFQPYLKFMSKEHGNYGVGYRLVRRLSHDVSLRKTVERMVSEGYELKFYTI